MAFLHERVPGRWPVYKTGQIITTSAEVTLTCGLVRESPKNPLNSGLGIIVICPDKTFRTWCRRETGEVRAFNNITVYP